MTIDLPPQQPWYMAAQERWLTSRPPQRILLGLTTPIGDTLFAQPVIRAVRRRWPTARITALVRSPTPPLAYANPLLDEVIVFDRTPGLPFVARTDITLAQILQRHCDLFIGLATSSNAIALLTGIPRQVWQRLPLFFWLWGTLFYPNYTELHAVELYWKVVQPLGLFPQEPSDHIPFWEVPATEQMAAQARLAALGIARPSTPVVLLHPGAAGYEGHKRWPAERFGALARHLLATGTRVIVLGGPQDIPHADEIVRATNGQAISLAGALGLMESIALITQADCYVGCDSGLTHFAVALDIPTVALYGPSSLAQFGPRPRDPRRVRVVLPQPYLPPTGFFIGAESLFFPPRHQRTDHMQHISVARVAAATESLLRAFSPAPACAGTLEEE
ncbi:MAG: glycosyltransferase family 9 protein [Ktedonobacterales bacterium]|nr:glycosyltransferase family 9 protein [Ktedonobacterales bacterium]